MKTITKISMIENVQPHLDEPDPGSPAKTANMGSLERSFICYLYPRPTKLEGGGILDSPCPSVRPSVRLSVDDMVSGA